MLEDPSLRRARVVWLAQFSNPFQGMKEHTQSLTSHKLYKLFFYDSNFFSHRLFPVLPQNI
jgi:hypothetical protein